MAYSKVPFTYTSGPQVFPTNFALGVLEADHIKVYVDGVVDGLGEPVEYAFTYNTATGDVTVTDALTSGQTGTINRIVPVDVLIADFEAGADVSKRNLVRAVKQTLMAVQEAADGREADSQSIKQAVDTVEAIAATVDTAVTDTNENRLLAEQYAQNAETSASQAQLYGNIRFTSVAAYKADASLTYSVGTSGSVAAGKEIVIAGKLYVVDFSSSSVFDLVNTTGVKLVHIDNVVSPEMFDTIGVTAARDTAAFQRALNTGKDVHCFSPVYLVSNSLTVYSQRLHGYRHAGPIVRAQSILVPQGNFPCFINPADTWSSFEIDGFFVDYGENAPVTDVGNDQKIGFKFLGNTTYPESFKISNCVVRGAWYGYYDDSGSYMSIMDRLEARHCKIGFFKQGGTTIVYSNCFARGDGVNSEMGFWVREGIASTLISCAADLLKPGPFAYAQTANMFEGCPGITISGWDAESNNIAANHSYMRFTDAGGSVSVTGFLGYQNVLNANTGEESTLVLFDGVNASFSGKMRFGSSDLTYVGTGGVPITLKAINGAKVDVHASHVPAATGGSPGAAFALLGSSSTINYSSSFVDGLVSGGDEYVTLSSLVDRPIDAIGKCNMLLNVTASIIFPGDIVPGTSLIYAAAGGTSAGVINPAGNWRCLGVCAANAVPAVANADCVSLFERVS